MVEDVPELIIAASKRLDEYEVKRPFWICTVRKEYIEEFLKEHPDGKVFEPPSSTCKNVVFVMGGD